MAVKGGGASYGQQDDTLVEVTVYTQNKKRFIWGCIWEIFFMLVGIGALSVSIGCFTTANQEKDNGEWLQIATGVLILLTVVPISLFLLFFLPHVFFSAVSISEGGIFLPRGFLLFRKRVNFTDISKINIESSGNVEVKVNGKAYVISGKLQGLSQLLWYIHAKHPHISCDEFVLKRISMWEAHQTASSMNL